MEGSKRTRKRIEPCEQRAEAGGDVSEAPDYGTGLGGKSESLEQV